MRHLPRAEPAGSTRALIGCGHLAPAGRRASSRDRANGNFTDGSHYDALVQKRNDKEKAELKRMCSHVYAHATRLAEAAARPPPPPQQAPQQQQQAAKRQRNKRPKSPGAGHHEKNKEPQKTFRRRRS
tara:strand:- start:626 stop:1009 length:384 start_codon:yes stop_codon:yes gene_type:complete